MARKNHPTLACFCVRVFLFIVLNEMSPLVSLLVGHVRNYFKKFVRLRTMSDQSMTFSETTKWGTIYLECGNSFTQGCHQRFWIYPLFEQKMFHNVQFCVILCKIFPFCHFFGCFWPKLRHFYPNYENTGLSGSPELGPLCVPVSKSVLSV